jgi:hypothetical protein
MNKRSQDLRAQAVSAFREYPNIVHGWCGASFPLTVKEARLLTDIIEEQECYCEDALASDTKMPTTEDPLLQYMYDKVVPQIRLAKQVLNDLRTELNFQVSSSDGGTIVLEPTRLQLTFLLQTLEWMEICMDTGVVVDLDRYCLNRKFSAVHNLPCAEFAYWLSAEYIDQQFGLARP